MDEVKLLPCEVLRESVKASLEDVFYDTLDCAFDADLLARAAIEAYEVTRPTLVTDEVVERPDVVKALWAIFMRIDTMPKSNKNMGLDVWTIKTLQLVRETIDLAVMPAIPPQSLGAIPGSHPTGQAPSGLGASRFDPERG